MVRTNIEDGSGVASDEVFSLFRASGYLGAAREAALAPVMADLTHTFATAYAKTSDVFEATVARNDRSLVGHLSCVRAYDRTWMAQHLVSTPSTHVSHLLSLGAMDRRRPDPAWRFFKIWYQEHNKWPRRVFGGFARPLTDARRSYLRSFRHVTLAVGGSPPGSPGDLEVAEAEDAERHLVANALATREPNLIVLSDDLDAAGLSLSALGESFAATGMARRRGILVARRRGALLGFALAELSSPGLNLYEILSTFRLFVLPEGEPLAAEVRRALLGGVARFYRSAGRASAHGLISCEDVPQYEGMGLTIDAETWTCWTLDRHTLDQFYLHLERLFACLLRPRPGSHQ